MSSTQDKASPLEIVASGCLHFGPGDFFVAGLETLRLFRAAFFCRLGKRPTFFVTGFATS